MGRKQKNKPDEEEDTEEKEPQSSNTEGDVDQSWLCL